MKTFAKIRFSESKFIGINPDFLKWGRHPLDRFIMKDKRCFICKQSGDLRLDTHLSYVYESTGKCYSVLLCYSHSVELFKMGQVSFMAKHHQDPSEIFGFEEPRNTLNYFSPR